MPTDLAGWLAYIEALHPKSIAMGLERVAQVRQQLGLTPAFPVILVAGTNGKGSTCAMLERIYHGAGYRVGCYTSPHLRRYNERVRIACEEIDDAALCKAFAAVESARQQTPLTYFEFGTLAAVWHFMQSGIDLAILEVGLGGRLDAVNVFEPACAIVTSVALDHMDYLGDNRESIGFEKAGVFRAGTPAICGDIDPPQSLLLHAQKIGADLKRIGRDFRYELLADGWRYHGNDMVMDQLPIPALSGSFQLANAASVITATRVLAQRFPLTAAHVAHGLATVSLAGRFQRVSQAPEVMLDVAHNPHAAMALAENLRQTASTGRTLAVFAMLADKDIAGVIDAVGAAFDAWYVADIAHARGAMAAQLHAAILRNNPDADVHAYPEVAAAFRQACIAAGENDRIVVFGSFYTVADAMRSLPLPDRN